MIVRLAAVIVASEPELAMVAEPCSIWESAMGTAAREIWVETPEATAIAAESVICSDREERLFLNPATMCLRRLLRAAILKLLIRYGCSAPYKLRHPGWFDTSSLIILAC